MNACATRRMDMRFIDVSLMVDSTLPVWPGDPPIQIAPFLELARGHSANASSMSCSVHTGTHVDAPRHHIDGGIGVDQLPLSSLVGPAYVADLSDYHKIDAQSLELAQITEGVERLLLKTTNSGFWANGVRSFREDYVSLTVDAAEWMRDRGVRLVGIDYLSVERFRAPSPVVHHALHQAGIVILEGLNLTDVRQGAYELICLPIKLRDLDGAPARAVLVDHER